MSKETIPVAVGSLILGFVLGIAFPQLFPDKPQQQQQQQQQQQAAHTQDDGHDHSQQGAGKQPEQMTDKQVDHIIEKYTAMLEKDPNNTEIYVSMGNISFDAGRYQQAIDHYQKAIEIDPKLTDARVDMATMYRKINQPQAAIEVIQEAIVLDPTHAVARLNLGIILKYDMKDYHLATNAFEEFLKIVPDHPQADLVKKFIEDMKPMFMPKTEPQTEPKAEAENPAS